MDSFEQNQSCSDECPIKKTANIIEGKWTTLIIRELLSGKKRYSELQKGLESISPKVLSARLRFLEEKKIIRRHVFPTIPPTTEYSLTPLGDELKEVLSAMAKFGVQLPSFMDNT